MTDRELMQQALDALERNLARWHAKDKAVAALRERLKQPEREPVAGEEWNKEPAIEGKHDGCLNCGQRPSFFPPDGVIAVGFGYAGLHRDGEPIYTEPNDPESKDEYMTGEKAEQLAAADPEHDWRIVMDGPLSGRTYQRHAPGQWALIEQNKGFA